MARINNAITFGSGFNISAQAPIDSRTRVEYESDLTNATTWPADTAPLYNGLIVSVLETGDVWILKNVNNYTNITDGTGWIKVGANVDIKDLIDSTGLRTQWSNKQDALIAGDNISIDSGGTISSNQINDSQILDNQTWSSEKINTELDNKQDVLVISVDDVIDELSKDDENE